MCAVVSRSSGRGAQRTLELAAGEPEPLNQAPPGDARAALARGHIIGPAVRRACRCQHGARLPSKNVCDRLWPPGSSRKRRQKREKGGGTPAQKLRPCSCQ
eukprot:scaffold135186_cov90-Phaeocystis_antarctica.AAC.1